ncbi:AI-2E family transporter [Candidatus Chloroploca sp. Khr17]|uniref:AI-2E family transporter n=1 Tax=Candidatus Chloroploca sp. Khr17 TaxID=2496869 RepID=UPI00101CF006|nr:AI-2E family transporter [Candidatus Chloroploca sp. Khr17]
MEQKPDRRSPLDLVSPGLVAIGIRSWLYLGVAAFAIAVLFIMSAIGSLVVPLVLATVIAMLFYPLVDWLEARRVPRLFSALGVMALLGVILVGALWLAVHGILGQGDQIGKLVLSGLQALERWTSDADLPVGLFDWAVTNALNAVPQVAAGVGSFFTASFAGMIGLFMGLFLGVFLLYYLLIDWHGIVGWLARNIGLAPALGEVVIANTTNAVRRYFYALTLSSMVVSVSIGSTMALLGLPLAVTIGLVTMVTSYVPYLGAIVSGIFAFLVALGSGGVGSAITVLFVVLLMQNIIQTIIQNKLASSQLRLHPLVTFIATILGGILVGILGAMLGTPAAAAIIRAREDILRLRDPQEAEQALAAAVPVVIAADPDPSR